MTRRRRIRYDPSKDLYIVLGIQPAATEDDIRRAFRQRAKAVHPDLNPQDAGWAHQQFQRLNEAYDTLSDQALRAEYDTKRRAYHRGRGPDGVAWWNRPHPRSAPPPDSSDSNPRPPRPIVQRRPTWSSMRRRERIRPYQLLFVISAFVLCGSVFSSMVHGPSNRPEMSDNAVVLVAPEGAEAATPSGVPLCSSSGALIQEPPSGANVTGRFVVRGTANDEHFAWYTVEIASSATPGAEVTPAFSPVMMLMGTKPIENGLLVPESMTQNLAPGDYSLRLVVWRADGSGLPPCEVRFHHRAP